MFNRGVRECEGYFKSNNNKYKIVTIDLLGCLYDKWIKTRAKKKLVSFPMGVMRCLFNGINPH